MTGAGFAYFCWQRQKRPGELPPGMRWSDDARPRLTGTPTLAGKYVISPPIGDCVMFKLEVMPRKVFA